MLIIVESPSKAKQISAKLGQQYTIRATAGHFSDLPKNELGFDINTFHAKYVMDPKKSANMRKIKSLSADSKTIIATDLDREGEAIGAHLARYLKLKNPIRIRYSEVTKQAILNAIDNPSQLDWKLANAQECRRIVDRAIGYLVSPLMIKELGKNNSAGRVQTVGLRVIVERDMEIENFKPEPYFNIFANLNISGNPARVKYLYAGDGLFDNKAMAEEIISDLNSDKSLTVTTVNQKERNLNPPAAFTTSTMQQEAANKLNLSVKETMKAAQSLFESGLISYHRTDSTDLSDEFVELTKAHIVKLQEKHNIKELFQHEKLKRKTAEGAQEAHEAIRPTVIAQDTSELNSNEKLLYQLIWERAVCSLLIPSKYLDTEVTFTHDKGHNFSLKGSVRTEKGWELLAKVLKPEKEGGSIPNIIEGEQYDLIDNDLKPEKTKPPAHFTQASIIKELERRGVGRPSTYESIITTIINRQYCELKGKKILSTDKGRAAIKWVGNKFSVFDIDYTSRLESVLDEVAKGTIDKTDVIGKVLNKLEAEIKAISPEADSPLKAAAESNSNSIKEDGEPCPSCNKNTLFRYPTKKEKKNFLIVCKRAEKKLCSYQTRLYDHRKDEEIVLGNK